MATKQTDGTATADAATTAPLPEAPVSLTIKVVFRGYDTLVTLRDATGRGAFTKLSAALDYIEANGGGPTLTRPAHAAPPPAGPQMLATGHATGPAGEAGGVIAAEFVTVEVDPKKGVTLAKFWRDDTRKYPEIQHGGKADAILSLLAPLGIEHANPARYDIPMFVHFTWGRERPPRDDGKPAGRYQDVVRVERAA